MASLAPPRSSVNHQVAIGDLPARKQLFLVDYNIRRAREMVEALSPLYDVTSFSEGSPALDAMYRLHPDLVVIDEQTMIKHGQGIRKKKADDPDLRSIPFIITSATRSGEIMTDGADGVVDFLLMEGVPFKALLERISFSLSQQIELGWKNLAVSAQASLKSSVTQFKNITESIANGTTPDIHESSEACKPLVECIQNGGHADLLAGLRDHHNYTYVHSLRVATYLTLFGKALGMNSDLLLLLSTGGMLHDLGKVAMPQTILNKAGKLDDQEWDVMRDHVVQSGVIIGDMVDVNPAIRIIAEQHHEKIDGSGYPLGLKGKELNELARMSTIVDIFGALTDKRAYKPAFDVEKSFSILKDMDGGLDQRLVDIFHEIIVD